MTIHLQNWIQDKLSISSCTEIRSLGSEEMIYRNFLTLAKMSEEPLKQNITK